MPAPRRLMYPARIISFWLTTSASAGASFRVEMKNWDAFMGSSCAVRAEDQRGEPRKIGAGFCGVDSRHPGAIMISTRDFEVDYARQGWVQTQRRHHPAQ